MYGQVTAYVSGSGSLSFTVPAGQAFGSGTLSAWSITQAPPGGATNTFVQQAIQNQSANYALAGGTATAATATPSPVYGAVAAGQAINLTMPSAATGVAMTLQVNAQAALPIKTNDGLDPTWTAGFKGIFELNTAATQWILKNPLVNVNAMVPVRQIVLAAPVDTGGLPSFLPATSGTLVLTTQNVTSTAPLVITASNGSNIYGDLNRSGQTSTNSLSWTVGASVTSFLPVTVNADGTLTAVTPVTLAPIYQFGGTPSVTSNQYTYNIQEAKMYKGNGTTAPQVNDVIVGECVSGASTITSTVAYAIRGRYDSGYTTTLVGLGATYTRNHNIGSNLVIVNEIIENVTTEGGYSVGHIELNPIGANATFSYPPSKAIDRLSVVVRRPATGNAYLLANLTTGVAFNLTAANWKYKIQASRSVGGVPW
jgi:hypothetical protein